MLVKDLFNYTEQSANLEISWTFSTLYQKAKRKKEGVKPKVQNRRESTKMMRLDFVRFDLDETWILNMMTTVLCDVSSGPQTSRPKSATSAKSVKSPSHNRRESTLIIHQIALKYLHIRDLKFMYLKFMVIPEWSKFGFYHMSQGSTCFPLGLCIMSSKVTVLNKHLRVISKSKGFTLRIEYS